MTACHNLIVLEHAGLGTGRLYAGSWSQWSNDPTTAQRHRADATAIVREWSARNARPSRHPDAAQPGPNALTTPTQPPLTFAGT